jgi:hypothetical protein
MKERLDDRVLDKPILSISVPPSQRKAFYQALVRLRQEERATFISASAIIVKTIIHAAAQLDRSEPPND